MPCVTQVRIPTVMARMQEVAVSKEGGGGVLALSERRPSLTKRKRKIEPYESQRSILHKGRDHSHEDHVADRGFHSLHLYNLVHTPVPISKTTRILAAKMSADKELEKLRKLPAWDTSKVQNVQVVIDVARSNNRKVHFAKPDLLLASKTRRVGRTPANMKRQSGTARRKRPRRYRWSCTVHRIRSICFLYDSR